MRVTIPVSVKKKTNNSLNVISFRSFITNESINPTLNIITGVKGKRSFSKTIIPRLVNQITVTIPAVVIFDLFDFINMFRSRRGRSAGYPTPPAQSRTCGFPASGSSVVLASASVYLNAH